MRIIKGTENIIEKKRREYNTNKTNEGGSISSKIKSGGHRLRICLLEYCNGKKLENQWVMCQLIECHSLNSC
jgi:hypothetical protein